MAWVVRRRCTGLLPAGASSRGRAAAGQLPDAVRGQMDAAFVGDFSAVRVHVGPQAERIDTIGSGI